jgi:CRISPR-associated protein Cmr1
METITFTCKVITPMFLSGADGQTPELRAPSIKGAMRFWWRAMHGEEDLAKLKKREEEIFGGGGESAHRSSFSIHVSDGQQDLKIHPDFWKDIGCEKRFNRNNQEYIDSRNAKYKGIAYVFYSTFMDYENLKTPIVDGDFKIRFMFKNSEKENILDDIIDAFKGVVYIGGIGARSRRGAGSISVIDIHVSTGLKSEEEKLRQKFFPDIKSRFDLEKFIKNNSFSNNQKNNSFSNLNSAKIYLFDEKYNWKDALESIAMPYKEFRDKNKSLITETPNFGFPIVHRSSRTTMVAGPTNVQSKKDLLTRRSSPIIFKIFCYKNKFFPMIIWLSGELIPSDYEIMDTNFKNSAIADYKIIEDYFETIENKITINL